MRKLLTILFLLTSTHLFAQTAEIYEKAADGYLDDKNYQLACDNYTQAIKKTGHDKMKLSVLYYKRGESLRRLEKNDEALKDYNNAIDNNADYSDAYWERGVVYDDNEKYQLALADYQKAIELIKGGKGDGNLSILYCNIAKINSELKNYTTALQADSVSISLDDKYSRAYKVLGNIDMAQKNYNKAFTDYTKAIFCYTDDDKEDLSYLFAYRADAKRKMKKYKDAINDYNLSINLYGKSGYVYWNRASAYHGNGDYKLAADDYSTAMTFYKNDKINLSKLYNNRAVNEAGETFLADAIKDDSIALTLDPTNKDAYYSRADAYTEHGDYQSSIDDFNKLLPMFSSDNKIQATIYFQIANDEYFLNQFDAVVANCGKAIDLNPEFSSSYFYRGKVYLKKTKQKDLAMKDFKKVLLLDTSKNTVNYIFSLFYIGRGDEAVSILQGNILKTNNDAELLSDYYNMACLYSLMNKPDEANIYLKKAIDNGYAKKYAVADEDLDNIRNTDDYKAIMTDKPAQ
jgi:tetratricopeptide (TPR) repeat protein